MALSLKTDKRLGNPGAVTNSTVIRGNIKMGTKINSEVVKESQRQTSLKDKDDKVSRRNEVRY